MGSSKNRRSLAFALKKYRQHQCRDRELGAVLQRHHRVAGDISTLEQKRRNMANTTWASHHVCEYTWDASSGRKKPGEREGVTSAFPDMGNLILPSDLILPLPIYIAIGDADLKLAFRTSVTYSFSGVISPTLWEFTVNPISPHTYTFENSDKTGKSMMIYTTKFSHGFWTHKSSSTLEIHTHKILFPIIKNNGIWLSIA